MKKVIFASGLLALMAAATSCEKYDIYPEEFDSVFTIRDSGTKELTLYATDEVSEYPFVIMKGGYDPETQSTATLKVMNDAEFAAYNESLGGMPYVLVGNECYSFTKDANEPVYAQTFEFKTANDKAATTQLYLRPRAIKNWIDANQDLIGTNTPVVPVTLVSETDTVNSYGNITLLKIDVQTPEFTVDVPTVTARTVNKQTFGEEGTNFYTPDAHFSIPCDNPWGFTLKLISDPDIIEDYNDEHGTSYRVMSPDCYTLDKEVYFAPGTTYMALPLTINLEKLPIKQQYAVAVAFDDPALVWDDANNNPGDALGFDKSRIMIFTVRVNDNAVLEKINLNATMVTGNDIEPTEGSIANLFDGDTGTYFHSGWSVANPREATYASYLEITLPEEKSAFRFKIANRNSAAAAGYMKTVHLFGTNDKNNWPTTPFATITNMNAAGLLDGAAKYAEFGTDEDPFSDGNSYKYIRFCVMESGGGSLGSASASIFWHASELEVYGY